MWIVLIVVAVLFIFVISIYNGLVRLKVQCENAWADIDVQLKRRYDLIPNVVETVKGYAAHEKGTLEAVINARSRAMAAQGPAAKGEAEGILDRKSTRLNSSHGYISYAVFCLKKKKRIPEPGKHESRR